MIDMQTRMMIIVNEILVKETVAKAKLMRVSMENMMTNEILVKETVGKAKLTTVSEKAKRIYWTMDLVRDEYKEQVHDDTNAVIQMISNDEEDDCAAYECKCLSV
jgi:hypothetical protein